MVMMSIVRLKYAHSNPLFYYSGLNPIWASNNESIRLLLEGRTSIGFVPLTHAAHNCDVLYVVPKIAIYSDGAVISARLFRGLGSGYAAVSDTSVNAMAVRRLLGIDLKVIDDPYRALRDFGAVLVIGDDALRMVDAGYPYILDVGELWRERVGLPLVYAVMAVTRNYDEKELNMVVNAIERSLKLFEEDPEPVIQYTAGKLGVSRELIRQYFSAIRYRVDDRVISGINEELRIFGINNCLRFLGNKT
ncbi:solute-binding protein [Vulcanisaeta moutnovskia 768-28]|uniref:Chorismate dehydratase n=2 Tax=Vulcanisaeta TaxID=164450 RepID=F0QSP4_VULM7|nr:solute-binding protein [Vulcanisaeta moutnovskia 768-28]